LERDKPVNTTQALVIDDEQIRPFATEQRRWLDLRRSAEI
jgi:hypothetical protein